MNRICGFFVLWADQPSFSLVRQLIKEGWQYLGGWDTLAQGTEGGWLSPQPPSPYAGVAELPADFFGSV